MQKDHGTDTMSRHDIRVLPRANMPQCVIFQKFVTWVGKQSAVPLSSTDRPGTVTNVNALRRRSPRPGSVTVTSSSRLSRRPTVTAGGGVS